MANVDIYEVTEVIYQDTVNGFFEQDYVNTPLIDAVGVSAPTIYYLMQANDSVTGTRYVWKWPSVPDWTGAGYTGPNSPQNIAIVSTFPA